MVHVKAHGIAATRAAGEANYEEEKRNIVKNLPFYTGANNPYVWISLRAKGSSSFNTYYGVYVTLTKPTGTGILRAERIGDEDFYAARGGR